MTCCEFPFTLNVIGRISVQSPSWFLPPLSKHFHELFIRWMCEICQKDIHSIRRAMLPYSFVGENPNIFIYSDLGSGTSHPS